VERGICLIAALNITYHIIVFFFVIFCQALENTFWGVSTPFLRQKACFGGD